MATAIVQLELNGRHADVRVDDRYVRARILLRWSGRPVGELVLPVTGGRIPATRIEEALAAQAGWDFWITWLNDSLGWDESEHTRPLPRATVAVCTKDRPSELRRCLAAIHSLPDLGHDIVVVDNNSTGTATAEVVAAFPGVRYVHHAHGGLNAARNRAVREARGDVVAFTDDDAFVDEGWLSALLRNFDDPLVLCATGLTMPMELETDAQEWLEAYSPFGRGFRRRVFDPDEWNPMAVGPVGAGANFALRRSVPDLVGEFDEALDGGTPTKSGGDHEMFSRILAAGYRIVYDPRALSWHKHRRSVRNLRETLRGYGTGVYAMWTRALLNREFTVFKQAYLWLRHGQVPEIVRSLTPGRRRIPLTFVLAELRGCVAGPRAYLRSRAQLRRPPGHVESQAGGDRGSMIEDNAAKRRRVVVAEGSTK